MSTNKDSGSGEELEKILYTFQVDSSPYLAQTSQQLLGSKDKALAAIRAFTQRQVLQGQIEELQEVKSMALTNFKNTDNNDMYVLSEYCKYRITNLKHELTQELNDVTEGEK
jgi:hypothetical protein